MTDVDPILVELLQAEDVLRALVRRLVATDDVEDILQTTRIAAWRSRSATPGLLAGIARRAAAFLHRGRARRRERERQVARAATEPSTAALVQRLDSLRVVAAAVCSLPEPYRAAVVQHYHGGQSIPAMATAVGVTTDVIRKRLQRGRDLLRVRLADEFGGDWRRSRALPFLLTPRRRHLLLPFAAATAASIAVLPLTIGAVAAPPVAVLQADEVDRQVLPPVAQPADEHRREVVPVAAATGPSAPDAVQDPEPAVRWQLTVTVLDPNGRPFSGAIVCHERQDRWTKADGKVRYELRGDIAQAGDRMTARESNWRSAEWQPVVRDGLRKQLVAKAPRGGPVELELRFADPLSSIAGTVLGADGTPAAGVTVFLGEAEPMDPGSWPRAPLQPVEDLSCGMEGEVVMGEGRVVTGLHVETAADGTFMLRGLRDRDYVLRAADWRQQIFGTSAAVPSGSEGVVIRMPAPEQRTVRGVVRDPAGRPLADVAVVALVPLLRVGMVTGHEVVAQGRSGPDGAFELAVPVQAAALAVRTKELLPVETPIVPEPQPTVLVTDTRRALRVEAGVAPFAAGSVQVLDAREQPLWLCAEVDSLLPPQVSWSIGATAALAVATSSDAAMVVFRDGDGVVRVRRPCELQADGSLLVR
ncbi:MAG: RNA polymerase sigma factor [Planctomycetes bacterium]|nr:RNA polymerase sigma factor [Planctomycetota bacterium]